MNDIEIMILLLYIFLVFASILFVGTFAITTLNSPLFRFDRPRHIAKEKELIDKIDLILLQFNIMTDQQKTELSEIMINVIGKSTVTAEETTRTLLSIHEEMENMKK